MQRCRDRDTSALIQVQPGRRCIECCGSDKKARATVLAPSLIRIKSQGSGGVRWCARRTASWTGLAPFRVLGASIMTCTATSWFHVSRAGDPALVAAIDFARRRDARLVGLGICPPVWTGVGLDALPASAIEAIGRCQRAGSCRGEGRLIGPERHGYAGRCEWRSTAVDAGRGDPRSMAAMRM